MADLASGEVFKSLTYYQGTQAAMLAIASKTGGRAFINTNDIAGAIHAAAEDSRVTHTVGFYPDPAHADGKFHVVKIKLENRRNNATLPRGLRR